MRTTVPAHSASTHPSPARQRRPAAPPPTPRPARRAPPRPGNVSPGSSTACAPVATSKFLTITPLVIRPGRASGPAQGDGAAQGEGEAGCSGAGQPEDAPPPKRARVEAGAVAGGSPGGPGGASGSGGGGSGGEGGGGGSIAWPGTGPEAAAPRESVCYVCELAGTPGKFDPQKAKELGVPHPKVRFGGGGGLGGLGAVDLRGRGHLRGLLHAVIAHPCAPRATSVQLYGNLQRGECVTLADGTVIRPDQVGAGCSRQTA